METAWCAAWNLRDLLRRQFRPKIGRQGRDFNGGQLPKTNSFATAGLIFGILSLDVLLRWYVLFNLLGLVFSLIGGRKSTGIPNVTKAAVWPSPD